MNFKTKLILVIIFSFIFGYCLIGAVFAGGVTDNNNGNQGNILIHSGTTNGTNDVGTWTDSSSFKGEKGNTGTIGETGQTGTTGEQGENGSSGEKGNMGSKGNMGNVGKQGVQGLQGKGLKDRVNLMLGIEHEGEKWIKGVHGGYDVNNQAGIMEIRFTRKIGESYTDRQIKYLQKQIDEIKIYRDGKEISRFEKDNMEIIPTSTGMKIQKKVQF